MKINGKLVLDSAAGAVIENLKVERVSALPAFTAADEGRLLWSTSLDKLFVGSGSQFDEVAISSQELANVKSALGSLIKADGTYDTAVSDSILLNCGDFTELVQAVVAKVDALTLEDIVTGVDNDMLVLSGGVWTKVQKSALGFQAADSDLTNLSTLNPAADAFIVGTGTAGTGYTSKSGAAARTALGLGSISTESSTSFIKTDGSSTVTADLNLGGFKLTNGAPGVSSSDFITKSQLDSAILGLSWKGTARAASTGNLTLSGLQTVDGVSLVAGDRILVKDQSTSSQNGIYVVSSSAWTRSTDASTATSLSGLAVFVAEGTTNKDAGFTQTAEVQTLGTDTVTFVKFSGAGSASVAPGSITQAELSASVAGDGLLGGAGTPLSVNVDNATLEIASDVVRVKNGGIANVKLANSTLSIAVNSTAPTTQTVALGKAVTFDGGVGMDAAGISTIGAGNTLVTVNAKVATSSQLGVAKFSTDDFAVTAGNVTLVAKDLSSLSDVVITSPSNGQTLVFNGTEFVNKKVFHLHDQTVAATSWVVTHNLGQKYCNVLIVDATDNMVIPNTITFDTVNQLTITVSSAMAGKAVISGIA